ncbi:Transcriptional regulatory protein CseB [Zhongshania aliphaticivorans]|uniref:Transcriptional regulatory protein CseB n=1 Tax=Zhongshania aliphaticivorans TaxID=1470434 RepID=A0A5S9Q5P2_9GAMM|nr:response regulator [Zhongshania aliphaticivorans]CAA0095300.1 Transcriptional regulatory protein CseB [Zhongshania aliphaticivorans]CAA0113116.1 Transcriptional regulatory protein CseB [Zhongshania aliphaticivorans]
MSNPPDLIRLMYVEDEPDIRIVAEIALAQVAGFTVKVCPNGTEALASINEFEPQLILLDVMMPGMDGPQILKKIQTLPAFSTTPVVFITAKAQAEEIEKLKNLGAQDVITKPFNPMTLGDDIRTIWRAYHESKQ